MRPPLRSLILAWSSVGLIFGLASYWEVRTHGHSVLAIFSFELLVWYGWALGTFAVVWAARRVPLVPFSTLAALVHVPLAAAFGFLHIAWWTGLSLWMRPFDDMGPQEFWPGVSNGLRVKAFFELMVYFAVLGTSQAADYLSRYKERETTALRLEASLAKAQLAALELQLQPHFLFNTLHAIGGLVRQSRGAEAVEMIANLSELLRYSLDHAGGQEVSLAREASVLSRYLDIQRVRFPDRLEVRLMIPPELERASLPALILQPPAENAVRHGIEPRAEPGTIELSVERRGEQLLLRLANSGRLGDQGLTGLGLSNTRARLAQLYGPRQSLTLEDGDGMVTATLSLPFREVPA